MLRFFIGILIVYVLFCFLLYLLQNKLLFHPEKLPANYKFAFDRTFEEINYTTAPGITLNALKFKAKNPKGVVLYLHGNAGSLRNWGEVADVFVQSGYDCLMIDYRGYGKSTGKMTQVGAIQDIEYIYNQVKEKYPEETITLYGRSLGSGMAAYLAAHHQPRRLIIESPYYSLRDVATRMIPIIPPFLLRFDFATYAYLPNIACPIYIFHGTEDEVIYYGSSQKLKEHFKEQDRLITVEGGGHNNLATFSQYATQLKEILQSDKSPK